MGVSIRPDTAKARISRNVDKMSAQGASDAEIEEYLQSEGLTPVAQAGSSGNVDLRTSSDTLRRPSVQPATPDSDIDNERGGLLTPIQHAAEGIVSGLPGGQRAVAGWRGLGSLLTGHSLDDAANEVDTSLRSQRVHVDKMPALARVPLQLIGGAPAAALAAPLGVAGGGAAVGAAYGADKPAEALEGRIRNTVIGGVLGGATAKGAQLAGRGIANVSNRIGLTDAIEGAVNKISPKLASTLGTRGQVNEALGNRQEILDKIGDTGESAGQSLLNKVASRKGNAKALYDAARGDTRVLDDPELSGLLNDPQVKQVFQRVSQIREAAGNPLPKTAAPDQVPLALQKMGVSPERYAELQQLGQSRRVPMSGVDILPPELLGEQSQGVEMPDPQALHQVKRALDKIIQGRMGSELPLSQDEALSLAPKVNAIRAKLHDLSPAWQEADSYYAHAMGEEQGLKKGFDAFRVSKNPIADKLDTNSPEALEQWISRPRYGNEPDAAMADRIQAFQQGGRQAMAGQVRNAPVTKDLSAILKAPSLAPTETGGKVRSMMFDSPQQSNELEQLLAKARGESMQESSKIPATGTLGHFLRFAMEPDLVASPKGQSLLAERLADAGLLTREIAPQTSTYTPITKDFGWDGVGPGKSGIAQRINTLPRAGMQTYGAGDFLRRLLGISAGGLGAR